MLSLVFFVPKFYGPDNVQNFCLISQCFCCSSLFPNQPASEEYHICTPTIEGYPTDVQVRSDMPTRPKNLYGVSKVYGEALANYYAYQRGLEAIAVRIGAFEYTHEWKCLNVRDLSAWSEPCDISSLFVDCLEVDMTDNPFFIAHAISDNKYKRLDISSTKNFLGYSPKSDAFNTWGITIPKDSKPESV